MNANELETAIAQTVQHIAYLQYVNCWSQALALQKHLEQLLEMQRVYFQQSNEPKR
jgi:hypothetical protein